MKALVDRARTGSMPGRRTDGLKIGLVIEGGGMRAVVSAGMVTALEYLGLRQSFDVVYGTSAGAINGAYFLAGQAAYGTTIYYENINNRNFIDFRRVLMTRPIWSLDYIFETVLQREKILDWKTVVSSPIPLRVFAACIDTFKLIRFDDFDTRESLFQALRASSSFPILTGHPFLHSDRRLFDGGLIDPIPFRYPLDEDGCTHVVVMITRPAGDYRPPDFLDRKLAVFLNRYRKGLADVAVARLYKYLETIKHLAEMNRKADSNIYTVQVPAHVPRVERSETRRERLVAGAKAGVSAIYTEFAGIEVQSTEVLRPRDDFGKTLSLERLMETSWANP